MNINKIIAMAAIALLTSRMPAAQAQFNKAQTITDKATLAKLAAAVEKMPDSLSAHNAYIDAIGIDNPAIVVQYEKWMKKFPASATIPFALGNAYAEKESPKAKPYLLKAVAIDPKLAAAWSQLSIDADRWGDFDQGTEYMRKASEADPSDPNYAFYYAYFIKEKDEMLYRKLSLDVAKRFPDDERGAQSLFWLAADTKDVNYKMQVLELLKNSYDPIKSSWSYNGIVLYYDLLIKNDPEKAIALAEEMSKKDTSQEQSSYWKEEEVRIKKITDAKQLIAQQKLMEAQDLLSQIQYIGFNLSDYLPLLKAEAAASPGAAYDTLMIAFFNHMSEPLHKGLITYGAKNNKTAAQVDEDIYQQVLAKATPATPFTLKRYLTPGNASLSDFKGKVVLLTYWFPGCGPCRGEFPHFENVIRKFRDKPVEYVGINIVQQQNAYVVPFLKHSGYSFTPLEDVEGRQKGNMDNRGAAPVNFLIDQQGRILFKKFRIDGDNEDTLEMMINLLLEHQA